MKATGGFIDSQYIDDQTRVGRSLGEQARRRELSTHRTGGGLYSSRFGNEDLPDLNREPFASWLDVD